jgi:hypothetical protein
VNFGGSYFIDTWSIFRSFVIFYGLLVQFVVIWYIFSLFGILYQEKSGKPGLAVSSPLATEETGAMGRVPPGHRVVVFLKKNKISIFKFTNTRYHLCTSRFVSTALLLKTL